MPDLGTRERPPAEAPGVVVVGTRADLAAQAQVLQGWDRSGISLVLGAVPTRTTRTPARTVLPVHRLSPLRTPSRWRRPVLAAGDLVLPSARRARYAARFDPWFRTQVRRADHVVLLGEAAQELAAVVAEVHPGASTVTGPDALARLSLTLVAAEVDGLEDEDEAPAPDQDLPPRLTMVLEAAGAAGTGGTELLAPGLRDRLRELLSPALGQDQALARARLLSPVLGGRDPVAAAYLARGELDIHARTGADPALVAAALLREAEGRLEQDLPQAVTWTRVALEVLFHRELHSDSVDSPLIRDPDGYLAPVRATDLWQLLTRPAVAAPSMETSTPRNPSTTRVLILPGAYGEFHRGLGQALDVSTAVSVVSLDRRRLRPHLRTMSVSEQVLEERLSAGLGRPGTRYPELSTLLGTPAPHVLVVDWADKTAVLATLLARPATRLVLRVHGVDVLRPWIHLVDWSRVEALVCVSEPLRALVVDVVGPALDGVPVHVIPNLVQVPEAVDGPTPVTEPGRDPHHLCLVGWAQRVKDPLWAVEVLARLREDGQDWRLSLLGHDFPTELTASGRAYAATFRDRAMADDVREHITYTGYLTDVRPVLATAGVVLSTSLREGFPVGLAEGVLGGAVPVVRDWPMVAPRGGARALYPDDWVVGSVEEAVARIRAVTTDPGTRARVAREARRALEESLDPEGAAGAVRELVLGEVGRLIQLSATGRHEEALSRVRAALRDPDSPVNLLHQAVVSAALAGEPSLRLEALRARARLDHRPQAQQLVRQQEGRLRELTPGWLPVRQILPGPEPPEPVHPVPGRVLHLLKTSLPYRTSGYAVRSFHLLQEQARAGHDVLAVTALDFPGEKETGSEVEDLVGGVRHRRLLREDRPSPEHADEYLEAFAEHLLTVVRDERPALLHAHSGHRGYELALVALAVGRVTGIPVVYEVRGFFEALWTTDLDRAEHAEMYRLRRDVEAHCLATADAVVTLSESMREDILGRVPPLPGPTIDPDRVFVVPNGVDVADIVPRPRRQDLVDRLGLEGRFTFGYVSNLDHPREGQELLVEAVGQLRRQGVDAVALVVGGGARRAALEQEAHRLGVAEHVIFTGPVPHEEVGDYYALLDVFVVPRIDEHAARLVTPLKPFEAMAMELPLVVSDLPALREVIGEGERGEIFPPGDADALATLLRELADDPDRRHRLARTGRAWVRENRTWAQLAERYQEVYAAAVRHREGTR